MRFLYMVLTGIVISLLLHSIVPMSRSDVWTNFQATLQSIIITIFIWEGNLRIDHYIEQKIPWQNQPMKRIGVQFSISFIYSGTILYSTMWLFNEFICELPMAEQNKFLAISLTIGLLISGLLLSIETGSQFFRQWKNSLTEVEKYKMESAQAQLESLKNQINPHFLFNNMSVLSSLVYKDQDKAVDFIHQLSKVYRYLLDNKSNELVSLKKEFDFIESYIYLLNIRYSPNLNFKIELAPDEMLKHLPPMSLQLLIENAIKHNEISSEYPLHISIYTKGNRLFVENPIQHRRSAEESSKIGLNNIQSRYAYFTDLTVDIEPTATHFIVSLPLLSIK